MKILDPMLIAALLVSVAFPLRSGFAEQIVFENPADVEVYATRLANRVYHEAFARLGLEYEVCILPANRALFLADIGKIDGLVHRVASFQRHYPSLVRVDESVVTVDIAVYGVDPALRIESWEDLARAGLRTNYPRSVRFVSDKIAASMPDELVEAVNSRASGLRKLLAGRADLYVDIKEAVDLLLASEFPGRKIVKLGTIDQLVLYPYLAAHRASMAPRLAETLRQMKLDGTMDRLRKALLKP
jgi:hypothetical protein